MRMLLEMCSRGWRRCAAGVGLWPEAKMSLGLAFEAGRGRGSCPCGVAPPSMDSRPATVGASVAAMRRPLARAGFSDAVRNLRFAWQRVGAQRAGEPRFTCEVGFENEARQCASAYTRQENTICACHPQSGRAYRDTISLPCYPAGGGTDKRSKIKK